jgi:hypothetical protein
MRRSRSTLSPRNARALAHRIMQAGPLLGGGVRQDRPHEEDGGRQHQRQCLNGSHDRPSPPRVSVASSLPSCVGDEHAPGAWPEDLDDRLCRSGHSASSAPPEEPHHDKRPHRDHEARRRARDAVNEIAGRSPGQRAHHEGQVHDVHDTQPSKPRSRGRPCDFSRACARRGVGAREATTTVWLWRRLVRVPRAPEQIAGVRDLTRRRAPA